MAYGYIGGVGTAIANALGSGLRGYDEGIDAKLKRQQEQAQTQQVQQQTQNLGYATRDKVAEAAQKAMQEFNIDPARAYAYAQNLYGLPVTGQPAPPVNNSMPPGNPDVDPRGGNWSATPPPPNVLNPQAGQTPSTKPAPVNASPIPPPPLMQTMQTLAPDVAGFAPPPSPMTQAAALPPVTSPVPAAGLPPVAPSTAPPVAPSAGPTAPPVGAPATTPSAPPAPAYKPFDPTQPLGDYRPLLQTQALVGGRTAVAGIKNQPIYDKLMQTSLGNSGILPSDSDAIKAQKFQQQMSIAAQYEARMGIQPGDPNGPVAALLQHGPYLATNKDATRDTYDTGRIGVMQQNADANTARVGFLGSKIEQDTIKAIGDMPGFQQVRAINAWNKMHPSEALPVPDGATIPYYQPGQAEAALNKTREAQAAYLGMKSKYYPDFINAVIGKDKAGTFLDMQRGNLLPLQVQNQIQATNNTEAYNAGRLRLQQMGLDNVQQRYNQLMRSQSYKTLVNQDSSLRSQIDILNAQEEKAHTDILNPDDLKTYLDNTAQLKAALQAKQQEVEQQRAQMEMNPTFSDPAQSSGFSDPSQTQNAPNQSPLLPAPVQATPVPSVAPPLVYSNTPGVKPAKSIYSLPPLNNQGSAPAQNVPISGQWGKYHFRVKK